MTDPTTTTPRPFIFASDSNAFDLDAYLGRIGHVGARQPSLDLLRALHRRHVEAIPFENLDAVLDIPIDLDAAALQAKLVHRRRGGYCFEQNLLFAHALDALGFRVTGLLARVLYDLPPDIIMPRTHMVLLVDVGAETFLADVGFGGQTLTRPLPMRPGVFEGTRLDTFRLSAAPDGFTLESHVQEGFVPVYRFDLQPQRRVDYEVANWYVSTHPSSRMARQVFVSRWLADRRISLGGSLLTTLHVDGRRERTLLSSAAQARDALAHMFGIVLPAAEELDAALAAALTSAPPA